MRSATGRRRWRALAIVFTPAISSNIHSVPRAAEPLPERSNSARLNMVLGEDA
jgi:hypothetical protein